MSVRANRIDPLVLELQREALGPVTPLLRTRGRIATRTGGGASTKADFSALSASYV
jgi:hypothetical protein